MAAEMSREQLLEKALEQLSAACHAVLLDAWQRPEPPVNDGRWLVKPKEFKRLRGTVDWVDAVLDGSVTSG